METQEMHRTPRDAQFLDTVAFGSMLVFASVMPSLGPDETDAAVMDDTDGNAAGGLEERCVPNGDWHRCA